MNSRKPWIRSKHLEGKALDLLQTFRRESVGSAPTIGCGVFSRFGVADGFPLLVWGFGIWTCVRLADLVWSRSCQRVSLLAALGGSFLEQISMGQVFDSIFVRGDHYIMSLALVEL